MDPVQISRAKLAGARGITLRYGLNPQETTQALVDVAFGLGMEPIMQVRVCVWVEGGMVGWEACFLLVVRPSIDTSVYLTPSLTHTTSTKTNPFQIQVKNAEEAKAATGMGVRLLFLVGNTRAQAIDLRAALPGAEEEVMVGFDLRRPKEFQYGLNEVEDAWVLRDHNFHAVYVSNLLFQTPLDDVVGPSAVIRALRAKACHFMVDPLDWIEKAVSEGTKETLGELLA